MVMRSLVADQRGLTLVELMLALALLGVVLAVGYNVYSWGERSFATGSNQSNVQRDIRLTSDFITREVRNANELVLLVGPDTPPLPGFSYIFVHNGTIRHINAAGHNTAKTSVRIPDLTFELERLAGGGNLLSFSIRGEEGTQTYEINSKVFLNNLQGRAGAQGQALRYRNP